MTVISFNKKGYDGFIDFIKAYAIIAVLIGHTVPNLDMVAYFVWLGMQVPLFLLFQAFHVFKKDTPKVLLSKIFQRVLVPFFAIEIITVILALIFTTDTSKQLIASVLTGGGMALALITLGCIYSLHCSYLCLRNYSVGTRK